MKLGTESKTKTVIAGVLLAVGIVLVVRTLRTAGPDGTATPVVAPAAVAAAPEARQITRQDRARYVAAALAPTLDPRLRLDLLKSSEGIKYEGMGKNIFSANLAAIPEAKFPGRTDNKNKPGALPPPPGPPPINLKFYGWASSPGEPKAIFLVQGDNVFVAHEGDIVARRYKVVHIGNDAVDIEDVLSNNKQSIKLTG